MRFLADENFPRAAVAALEAAGHDVVWVRTAAPGAADADILAQATQEQRILLTFDKDFGELAGRSSAARACGVVLVRVPPPKSTEAARLLGELIEARSDWAGHFSVIEPGRVRMRSISG
jgi:predicted nuclease of predicted toxin-antitoxin system